IFFFSAHLLLLLRAGGCGGGRPAAPPPPQLANDGKIPIFLSSDDKYAPFIASTISSILFNTKSYCDFYVLDGNITELNKDKIMQLKDKFNNFSIEFVEYDSTLFKDMRINVNPSFAAYARFIIPVLKKDIKKCLYLDVDLVVCDDIKKLFCIDLQDKVIGAVCDRIDKPFSRLRQNSSKHVYFNSGVLLIDCEKWREQNITQKLFEIEARERDNIIFQDQDVLNIMFDNNYKILPLKYNLSNLCFKKLGHPTIIPSVIRAMAGCVIRHYVGPSKPWNVYKINSWGFNKFWFYMKMTVFYKQIRDDYVEKNKFENIKNPFKRIWKIIRVKF
ncbi:MAG: glycosyltransferase family 8 protein, partial [Rickettsiales bacterium]|nr:glycosyltransferase family 8 protein [Rickettsiales bacterium]